METSKKKRGTVRLLSAVKIALFFLVLGVVARYGHLQWTKLPPLSYPDTTWLALGWLAGVASCCLIPLILRRLLALHNLEISYGQAVGLYFIPVQGRYIPGKVWSFVWAVAAYQRQGADWPTAFACLTVLGAVNLISAMLVSFTLGVAALDVSSFWLVLALVSLVVLHPRVFYGAINATLTRFRKEPIHSRLTGRDLGTLLALNSLYWCGLGCGLVLICRAFFGVDPPLSAAIAAQALAVVTGMLAFFAPAGLGVREGTLTFLLTPSIGAGVAISLAVLQRLWQLSIELPLAFLGCLALHRAECSRTRLTSESAV